MVRYLSPLVWPWTLKICLQCLCQLRFTTETSDCVPKASSDCPFFLHVKSCVKMHLNLSFRWQKFFTTETSDCVPKASSDCPFFLHVKSCVKMHLNLSFRWQKFFWFRSCWRSLKMVPFDRPYTTFYWSATVNTAISCTVFELFDVEWYRDLQIWITDHSRSFRLVPFESLGAVSYRLP